MKKSIVISLSLIIAIVLYVPSVPSLADGVNVPGYYTQSCMAEVFSGAELLEFQSVYSLSDGDFTQELFDYFNSLDLSAFTSYFIFSYGPKTTLIAYDSTKPPIYAITEKAGVSLVFPVDDVGSSYATTFTYDLTNHSGSQGQEVFSRLNNDNMSYYYYYTNLVGYPTGVLSVVYYSGIEGLYVADTRIAFEQQYDYVDHGLVNFYVEGLPFYDGEKIVDPDDSSVSESNNNHLYLSNFDAGYCKPYHMEELYRAGGGYLYFTYDFDSWINSHSDDYQLQVITQLNVDGTATTYNSVWPLDLQGCLVLPFNRLASSYQWSDENILFIEYEDESLFSNYNRGYVYAINYLKYVDPNTQKGIRSMGNGRTRSFVSSNGSTHRLIGDDPAEENYFSGNSNHTQFLMSVTVRMVDNVSGDVSGSFTKTFNLLNGVSTVSNNQIRDNTNPYEPTSDDLYFPIQDSGGGYGYGGGNNQLVNFQFPSDIELFIDNGFKQFLVWYETSADTAYATNRFWSSMGIFEGNPASELYKEYFGFLPDDFKTLIFSCAGIGIVGGAFCILRRRLH